MYLVNLKCVSNYYDFLQFKDLMESLKTFKYFICLMNKRRYKMMLQKIGIYLFNPLYIDGFKSTFKTKVYNSNSKETNLFIFFNV